MIQETQETQETQEKILRQKTEVAKKLMPGLEFSRIISLERSLRWDTAKKFWAEKKDELGCSYNRYSVIEKGTARASLDLAKKIIQALDILEDSGLYAWVRDLMPDQRSRRYFSDPNFHGKIANTPVMYLSVDRMNLFRDEEFGLEMAAYISIFSFRGVSEDEIVEVFRMDRVDVKRLLNRLLTVDIIFQNLRGDYEVPDGGWIQIPQYSTFRPTKMRVFRQTMESHVSAIPNDHQSIEQNCVRSLNLKQIKLFQKKALALANLIGTFPDELNSHAYAFCIAGNYTKFGKKIQSFLGRGHKSVDPVESATDGKSELPVINTESDTYVPGKDFSKLIRKERSKRWQISKQFWSEKKEQLNCSYNRYAVIENGSAKASLDLARKIISALELSEETGLFAWVRELMPDEGSRIFFDDPQSSRESNLYHFSCLNEQSVRFFLDSEYAYEIAAFISMDTETGVSKTKICQELDLSPELVQKNLTRLSELKIILKRGHSHYVISDKLSLQLSERPEYKKLRSRVFGRAIESHFNSPYYEGLTIEFAFQRLFSQKQIEIVRGKVLSLIYWLNHLPVEPDSVPYYVAFAGNKALFGNAKKKFPIGDRDVCPEPPMSRLSR